MNRIYIGIDNGVTGALCAISEHGGPPFAQILMPIQKTKKGNEVDIMQVRWWLSSLGVWESLRIVIEEPGGSQSAKAAASMAHSFGALRGAMVWQGLILHRITPQAWQKRMLGKCAPGTTKATALTKARELWPAESWLPTPRCKTPSDALVDAALIAEFGRREGL